MASIPHETKTPQLTRRRILSLSASVGVSSLIGTSLAGLSYAGAQETPPPPGFVPASDNADTFKAQEIIDSGHRLFGTTTRELAVAIQSTFEKWGEPNGYIIGQEASGAFFGGLRYGEGTLYTRRMGERPIFWQGPSLGFDFGGSGNRTMILIYNMPTIEKMFQRFAGVDGSAYLMAGFAVSALAAKGDQGKDVVVVPIRTGVGVKLGINIGYLKFTPESTWNPF